MSESPTSKPTILFAQVNSFSYTNDALLRELGPHLPNHAIEAIRVYPIIRKNLFLLGLCYLGIVFAYGFRAAFDRKTLTEKIIKTPIFFGLASYIVRNKARNTPNLVAILQTQGLFNAKVDGVPLVIYTDNTILNRMNRAIDPEHGNVPILKQERKLYKSADKILVCAEHVVTSLRNDYGIDSRSIENVRIGANSPAPASCAADRYRSGNILFVGIDWERKGGPALLSAFKRLREQRPDARLIIAGCNPDIANVQGVIALGRIAPTQIAALLGEAAIFCLPSRVEPFGIAVIEAARAGLPTVGTAVGGMIDSIVDEKTGILVPVDDVDALEAALGRLLADPDLCEKMGTAAREWAKEFEWASVALRISRALTMRSRYQGDRA
ncbi:glycosyltransferase family 4 protein [Bosea sp. (in: a-proteobacteria)]|uniref:glycosyltransferase family 4 protein n=1 Tax=Bosea sp. (in: a-proteobacteria) TaxID=1871050 RepID=UPI001201D9C7|nr:glycosyltransferase family 4 protein [Bosea sp. (in: a-proteobacteria)]TAJ31607.1 MAG: glycosyltransferase family 1 protein [Bosea sp. (in: a-proteobacteria)]